MFNRTIINELETWKNKEGRKPLIMLGARQVGKTSVLKRFGKEQFDNCAYFSLDEEKGVCDIFRTTKNPIQIIEQLTFLTEEPILPQKTLLILDEIQDCPEAICAMKYFCEKTPEYAVVCAGALLGLAFGHEGFSFPVGKVDHINMYPVTFSEFLEQKDAGLYRYYQSINSVEPLPQVFFDRLSQAFTAYRISGGMPEAAMKMIEKDMKGMETTLQNILQDYTLDFVKHSSPLLANRISHVWNSLPSQLAKENRKFVYQLVRPGARAREYEDALIWLQNAGLIHKVSLCQTPQIPLKSYEDLSIFKIYCLDIGLLRVLSELSPDVYLMDSPTFKEYKGALAENYILQSLLANGIKCSRYWASGNKAEVEFIVQHGIDVIPIEVKSGTSVTGKSLIEYNKKYSPSLRCRFSMLNLKRDDTLLNIPLFLADRMKYLCKIIT
ncbi:MAG: AAA family ATPase [Bacteroidales bacterium]|nr:AAA family ATPase [Bacteroidales bacterium]